MIKVIAITGYKPKELGIYSDKHPGVDVIKHAIFTRLTALVNEGAEWFVTSGQPGVELWASEVVINMKQEHPQVKLSILTPFLEQESRWPDGAKEKYYEVLRTADHVDSITKRPYEHSSQLRLKNDFIIRKSDGLLVVYDEETPGSPDFYLKPAKRRQAVDHYPIFQVNRYDIEAAGQDLKESDPDYWSQT